MKLEPFVLERWLAQWDTVPGLIDIAASGVAPISVRQLLDLAESPIDVVLDQPLDYGDTRGSAALRGVIAATYLSTNVAEVLVTCGAIEAMFLLLTELIEPGDEVVVVSPGYQQYAEVACSVGATVIPWQLTDGYDVEALERLVTPRTKLVVVNNPHNPTGVVLGVVEAEHVYDICDRAGAWLLCDEVSRWLEAPGAPVWAMPGRDFGPRAISVGGVSKALGLPGLRIGWMAGPSEIIDRCWSRRDYVSLAPGALDDALAVLALRARETILDCFQSVYAANLATVAAWADRHRELVTWEPPAGGVVGLMRYDPRIGPSSSIVSYLANKQDVLLGPGSAFGVEYALRLGVGGSTGTLTTGLARLGSGLSALAATSVQEIAK